MSDSKIEWTGKTWNPLTGCDKISPGCKNCYAERMAFRLKAMGQERYINGFDLTIHEDVLMLPLQWKRSAHIFVNSMSDLFHENVPFDFIQKTVNVMERAEWHIFQVLTKRSRRLKELSQQISWPENVWLGVSVENDAYAYRLENLLATDAKVKFASLEPLLGPITSPYLSLLNWVIVGGESGPYARPMDEEWVLAIRDQCRTHGVPFFFKQWGGVNKKKTGRLLEGQVWEQMPPTNPI